MRLVIPYGLNIGTELEEFKIETADQRNNYLEAFGFVFLFEAGDLILVVLGELFYFIELSGELALFFRITVIMEGKSATNKAQE